VVHSGIVTDKTHDKHPREWTKQALKTLDETMESYIVEIIAKSHIYKQQLISYRFSICQLLWLDREVRYS